MMTDRSDFLKSMYEQMFRDIAQQIQTVWQSAATVFASFAIIALAEKQIVPIDLAIAVIVLLTAWFMLNVVECSYWYNRNLCIIANIERQFLVKSDLKDIQYYFGAHRPDNKMISQLRNQMFLGWSLVVIVLAYHFSAQIWPGFGLPLRDLDPIRALPYIVAGGSALYLMRRMGERKKGYAEFVRNSPGATVDASDVHYGVGHGH